MIENEFSSEVLRFLAVMATVGIFWQAIVNLFFRVQDIRTSEQPVSSPKRRVRKSTKANQTCGNCNEDADILSAAEDLETTVHLSDSSLDSISVASVTTLDDSWSTSSSDELLEDSSLSDANGSIAGSSSLCGQEPPFEWESQQSWSPLEERQQDSSSEAGSFEPDTRIQRYPVCNQLEPHMSAPPSHSLLPLEGSTPASPTSVKETTDLLEAMLSNREPDQEKLVLSKLPVHKANHPMRVPCPAVDMRTRQRLEFLIYKMQLQNLLGSVTQGD